ncbi:hypothetical protein C8J57DRAFT_1134393 [Mycena rebaudengoi]|nr:hypothetical protein C8J57DRAFT_1134393 [Mycena rebaudengoi]
MGRVVIVKGHAFKTWNALLYYLYTNKIVFRTPDSRDQSISQPPECSAKSMYKLADRFELNELKAVALQSLRSQFSADNIVREAFSTFTSLFPEIQDIEVEFLICHLPNLALGINEMLRSVCDGAKPHCFDVLRKIACRSEGGPPVPRSRRASSAVRTRSRSRSRSVRSPSPARRISPEPTRKMLPKGKSKKGGPYW